MAWSDVARQAAAEARRRRAVSKTRRITLATASHNHVTMDKRSVAVTSEQQISRMLRSHPTIRQSPLDAVFKRGTKQHGVEIKTLIDQKNNKITMHPEALARKIAWGKQNKAILHTVVVDRRMGQSTVYYKRGVGSFRLASLSLVRSAAQLRRFIAA